MTVNIEGGVTAPKGFTASGYAAAIKPTSRKMDCALVASDRPAVLAGVFTTNIVKSPTVEWNVARRDDGVARAVFVNSGNANTCTGEQGKTDVRATAGRTAERLGVQPGEICVCSTGVIGVPLPMDRIFNGVDGCADTLSIEGGGDAAIAIMTTDTVPKEVAMEVTLSGGVIRIGGIAKGSGMICPNMATMICVLTTDAGIARPVSQNALNYAAESSFNRICIDNDMSTSDSVLFLANGASGVEIKAGTPDEATFRSALKAFCQDIARRLVKDGEGATKFVEIRIEGAASDADAKIIARAIAHSHLCKTAFYGQDPNWGRITCAAGYSGAMFDAEQLDLWLDAVHMVHAGCATGYLETDAAAVMRRPEFAIRLKVGDGAGKAVYWTSDLSVEYVHINADYRS